MVEYSAGVRLHGVYPLGNRDRVIRLFEGNFLDSLSEAAQESPTSRRLPWRRTKVPNPGAGKEHIFRAWRLNGSITDGVSMRDIQPESLVLEADDETTEE